METTGTNDHRHDDHDHDHGHDHGTQTNSWNTHAPLLGAFAILLVMLSLEYGFGFVPRFPVTPGVYVAAYFLAGYNVLYLAWRKALRFDFFNEFFLMSAATLGAFSIGAYSEGVAVMVFYSIGEWFQDSAVSRAKRSIKALLDIRPEQVQVLRDVSWTNAHPNEVQPGETIQVRPGEKVALDGELMSANALFNTAALTGESKPETKRRGEPVYAGMISLNTACEIKVTAKFSDSKLSRILEMVQDATARKSKTQLFINRFAKIYTPVVFLLAIMVVVLPYFFVEQYQFYDWFYRALVFLVISCPCGLVVSIPLGYFGGIGLASRQGILFKGSNFLDVMTQIDTVVLDKTGTLTEGVFKVQQIVAHAIDEKELLRLAAAIESKSAHPIAQAIAAHASDEVFQNIPVNDLEEIPGHGLKAVLEGKEVLAGNARLLSSFGISFPDAVSQVATTVVLIAIDKQYAGYIAIADAIKPDAQATIQQLHALGIRTIMLSGDKQQVVDQVAATLSINNAFGGLLPEDKVQKVQSLKDQNSKIAFVGDGVNDAPVLALADVGIAMGGLGSDAAIETADVVIQNDNPLQIVAAIKVGKATRSIVWQNIIFALSVKIIVLMLGAGGVANLWEAVIADVGVALLAILNAVRLQRLKI